jgi:hypothetical protein
MRFSSVRGGFGRSGRGGRGMSGGIVRTEDGMRVQCGTNGTFRFTRAAFVAAVALAAGQASAAPNLFDDFENGVGTDPVWTPITGVNGTSTTPVGINNLMTTSSSHNHTPGGVNGALTPASNPAAWNGYTDFGSTATPLVASVWIFEDLNYTVLADPGNTQQVNGFIGLVGESGGQPSFTDFLYCGVVGQGGSSAFYGTRSLAGGFTTSAIPREAGWTKLKIEVDGNGGAVRFYVDTPSLPETLIATSTHSNANLRFVRLGTNASSQENFWYDDVSVVPEPGALALLGLGAAAGLRRRSRCV